MRRCDVLFWRRLAFGRQGKKSQADEHAGDATEASPEGEKICLPLGVDLAANASLLDRRIWIIENFAIQSRAGGAVRCSGTSCGSRFSTDRASDGPIIGDQGRGVCLLNAVQTGQNRQDRGAKSKESNRRPRQYRDLNERMAQKADRPEFKTKFDIAAARMARQPVEGSVRPLSTNRAEESVIASISVSPEDRHGIKTRRAEMLLSDGNREKDDGVNRSKNKRRFELGGIFLLGHLRIARRLP